MSEPAVAMAVVPDKVAFHKLKYEYFQRVLQREQLQDAVDL